jgi:hypothetical protein
MGLGRRRNPAALLDSSATHATTLALAHSSPDTELLTVRDRELKTVNAHHAAPTDLFRLTSR